MNARKRPIEIAEELVAADNWYSVVISNLDNKVEVQDIQNKIYTEIEDEEGFAQTKAGGYISKYAEIDHYREGISLYTTHKFATQKERYNELSEDQKIIVDSIKQISNTFPCAFYGTMETQMTSANLLAYIYTFWLDQKNSFHRFIDIVI